MTEAGRLDDLRKNAVFELDQMDKALALTKNFSQMFDAYMKKLQGLVVGLLEADFEEDEFFHTQNTVKFQRQHSLKNENVDRFRRGPSFDRSETTFENYRPGVFSLQRENTLDYNSVYTGNFNSTGWSPDHTPREQTVGYRPNDQKDENLFSALQVQTQTINKIIEAGEVNSKNLREIIEKLFTGRESNSEASESIEKVQNLKKKLAAVKKDLELKDKENQQLKIDLAVSQKLKQEVEGRYTEMKRNSSVTMNSQKSMLNPCTACEAYRHENYLLINQLSASLNKIDTLNQNIESLKNEFIDLYKTTQEHLCLVKMSNKEMQSQYELEDLQAMFMRHNGRPSMDSNLNTIMYKLDGLEASMTGQTNLLKSDYRGNKLADYSYVSKEDRAPGESYYYNGDKSIELRYSSVTNPISLPERPNTGYAKYQVSENMFSNQFTVPVEYVLSNGPSNRVSIKEGYGSLGSNMRNTDAYKKETRTSECQQHEAKQTNAKASEKEYADPFNESLEDEQNTQHKQDNNQDAEEHYSIVEMSNSMDNSLEEDDNPFDIQPTSEKQGNARISFAKKEDLINKTWADPRSSNQINQRIGEIFKESDDMVELESGSEDMQVYQKHDSGNQFYTFSNHNSNRKEVFESQKLQQ